MKWYEGRKISANQLTWLRILAAAKAPIQVLGREILSLQGLRRRGMAYVDGGWLITPAGRNYLCHRAVGPVMDAYALHLQAFVAEGFENPEMLAAVATQIGESLEDCIGKTVTPILVEEIVFKVKTEASRILDHLEE